LNIVVPELHNTPIKTPGCSAVFQILGKQFENWRPLVGEGASMHSVKIVASVVVLMIALPLYSQTGTSTIRGAITDPNGRLVAGAKVTITNLGTNGNRTTTSTDTGTYAFDLITPAAYRLEVEAKGFRTSVVDHVQGLIGKTTEANVQLQVGAATETVEVKASAQDAIINTQDATLGNNFESLQITQLPLEARNVADLLSLQPGSTREGYVTGARADQSNVTLDGVDINNAQTGNAEVPRTTNTLVIGQLDTDRGNITTGPVLRLNSEAVEEFRVTTANGNANQGRSSGSQVNLITKAGTNSWHGAGFEFYRSTGFTANDWFNNHAGVARQPLIRHTFGGGIGGPIIKNKAFFFYSYESRHDASGRGVTQVVPLASLGQGIINYSYCPDTACASPQTASLDLTQNQQVYNAAGLNPVALKALADAAALYPANDSSQGDGLNTGGFRFNSPTPIRLNSHVAKLDFNLNSRQTAFVRANVIYDHQTLPKWLPAAPSPLVWNHPWGLAAGHTWTIGNHLVNNFRYGYTRQAFSEGGDSTGNDISFRFVFQPNGEAHTLTRVTPVHNFTDDVSWIRGNHNFQFGGNIRTVSNTRVSFANAFDNAVTNPSFYASGGEIVSDLFQQYLVANSLPGGRGNEILDSTSQVQNAATAIIGRLSQFTSNFTFSKNGTLLNSGSPAVRDFATQSYDMYLQDTWKVRPTLTLTLGLRYSLERPVYETQGFEVQPNVPLSTFFAQRQAAAAQGTNFTDPVVINRSGPANGGKPMYPWDKNNFQPRLAFAWSPDGGDGFFGRLLGRTGRSVIRGGFAMTNDYYGQALAVDWDLNNTLGFTSSANINANTYNIVGTGLAPLFTGFNQDVRSLFPPSQIPTDLKFPLSQAPLGQCPAGGCTGAEPAGEAIQTGIDSHLHSPTEYVWNLTFERQLPKGMVVSASYIGRRARDLLARRDVTAFNDVRDPKSGMDWYTAGTMLEKQRAQGVPTDQIASIPFFDNLFPANLVDIMNNDFTVQNVLCGITWNPSWTPTQMFYAMQSRTPSNPEACFGGNDWTDTQGAVDTALYHAGLPTRFMHPQYGALSAWSTIAYSNYNALAFSVRQRLSSLTLDFNYTLSHSLDNASGLQSGAGYATDAFIVNPLRPDSFYGSSSFDVRHNINASGVWQMPFGKGHAIMSSPNKGVQAIFGGWQLSGIFRWNTGLPQFSPYDDARWATNWNVQANVTPTSPIHPCPSRTQTPDPKMFGTCDINKVYQGFRNAYPGETGPRNYLRLPGYVDVDFGLGKSFTMPYNENHQLQLRWDVFNATNTQRFGAVDGSRTGFGVVRDPLRRGATAPDNWSNFIQIQGQPRVMQVGARYSF
jgi:hypothetical protein